MKNRFKFIVWDTVRKEIIGENDPFFNGDMIPSIIMDGSFWAWDLDGSANSGEEEENVFIKMQCTGAKDINDNLIYEGFIVKEGDSFIKVIEYDEQYAGYGLDTKAYSYEILGNIYQHKHLLEDGK